MRFRFKFKFKYLSWPFIGLIYLYRFLISPILGPKCRFYPTCSAYAIESLKTKSFFVALWLIIKRLLKCHPWHLGGYDPVPNKNLSESKEKKDEY